MADIFIADLFSNATLSYFVIKLQYNHTLGHEGKAA